MNSIDISQNNGSQIDRYESTPSGISIGFHGINLVPPSEGGQKNQFKVSNLSFSYKQPLFSNLNLEIPFDEITVLTGENGSGKTTFCRILSGLIKDYEGTIEIRRSEINEKPLCPENPDISPSQGKKLDLKKLSIQKISDFMIYHKQEPQGNIVAATPDEDLSIWQSKFTRRLTDEDQKKRKKVLAELDISELLETPFWEQSSGQIKRSGLAALLLNKEKFWILDEPFSGLHQQIVDKMIQILIERKKSGFGALIISHKTDQLNDFADHILKIEDEFIKEIK
ncbi:MAG: energy-coupling factor ABC transporter ATP-binding protein [Candidatus Cloacimonetes bacterium]|nr:energy-coupling factor ABC transporter ATP-binding protein [Candidatus Cloacimonadota bacterium]MCF7814836.1 energy-coupling factor ABC transporter ATP-binding protein [Candidatus Cloacimonadota bacterium]MCF7867892.1 energy-coupling factor ABC transporter ATP-binding protein [Candidatus Cloacimonadota bacterium]MCF7883711.1 energy-coupling factor ABC transporter ATP-binding protein [Candidatus Cloacimonadota bacterium]